MASFSREYVITADLAATAAVNSGSGPNLAANGLGVAAPGYPPRHG